MSELPTLEMINSALDKLRPNLERDGGDVEVVRITKEGTVEVKMLGACLTCAQSTMTMIVGIEKTLKDTFPSIPQSWNESSKLPSNGGCERSIILPLNPSTFSNVENSLPIAPNVLSLKTNPG